MPELRHVVRKLRSKNAGPFKLTIDIFCGEAFARVRDGLTTEAVADLAGIPASAVARYDIEPLRVVKFSFVRPEVQGAPDDRDMHGAALAAAIGELTID